MMFIILQEGEEGCQEGASCHMGWSYAHWHEGLHWYKAVSASLRGCL